MKLFSSLAIGIIVLSLIAVGLSLAQEKRPNIDVKSMVEVAHQGGPHCKTPQQAIAVAFAALSSRMRLDQPLFVKTLESKGSFVVDFFSSDESGKSIAENVDVNSKLAFVSVGPKGTVGIRVFHTAAKPQRSSQHDSVMSAVVFLEAIGALPESFLIRTMLKKNGDCMVNVRSFPLTPDAEVTVLVSDSELKLQR